MAKSRPTTVKFFENKRNWYWHIPSGEVRDALGGVKARNCYTLQQARDAVNGGKK